MKHVSYGPVRCCLCGKLFSPGCTILESVLQGVARSDKPCRRIQISSFWKWKKPVIWNTACMDTRNNNWNTCVLSSGWKILCQSTCAMSMFDSWDIWSPYDGGMGNKSAVIRDVNLCLMTEIYWGFGETRCSSFRLFYSRDGGSVFLYNVGKRLPNCMATHLRRE